MIKIKKTITVTATRVSKSESGVAHAPYNPWTSVLFNTLLRKFVATQMINTWDIYTEYDSSPSQVNGFFERRLLSQPLVLSTSDAINAAVRKKMTKSYLASIFS